MTLPWSHLNGYWQPLSSQDHAHGRSKGRVVLPKEVRERLGITTGSEVEVREEDGRVVVEPEDDPDEIVANLETLIEAATSERDRRPYEKLGGHAKGHVDAIRRQANESDGGDK